MTFGLDDPELTTTVEYCTMDSDGNSEESGTLVLHLSRNPEELAAYEQAVEKEEDDLPEVPCYVRLDQSQIVYKISQSVYDQLTEVSYDKLRHQKLFTADFDTVTSIDVSLNEEAYHFVCHPPEDQEDEDAESTLGYITTRSLILPPLRLRSVQSLQPNLPRKQLPVRRKFP